MVSLDIALEYDISKLVGTSQQGYCELAVDLIRKCNYLTRKTTLFVGLERS